VTDVTRLDKPKKRARPKKQSQTATADTLFSLIVRAPGKCVILGCPKTAGLQCAHGFSRRYRATRWDERNAFCMCQGHHHWYTHRPLEWDEWLRAVWGPELYETLRETALRGGRTDFKTVLDRLRARHREVYT
jgi:HNH endonuclease